MNDTQKRIEAYRKQLPGLKERVLAVALLLVVSITIGVTTTFAWVVLSRSPEVSGVSTSVASNGNLEIALATGDGKNPPDPSGVGDSFATEGQSVVNANTTWGNMINLSDPAYGLDHLVLRPAQLNETTLLTKPLSGTAYGADGRIEMMNSNFAYTTWIQATEDVPAHFGFPEQSDYCGVRAISSVTVQALGADKKYNDLVTRAEGLNKEAQTMYRELINKEDNINSLARMMGLYMTARMNSQEKEHLYNPEFAIEDVQKMYEMYVAFADIYDKEMEAIAQLLNTCLLLEHGLDEKLNFNFNPYTKDMIYDTSISELKEKFPKVFEGNEDFLKSLDQLIKDRNTIKADSELLLEISTGAKGLKWRDSGLNTIVNHLVNVGECTVAGKKVDSIGASAALTLIMSKQQARITNGILWRFEEQTGGRIAVQNLGITATVYRQEIGQRTATLTVDIETTAPKEYLFGNDWNYVTSLNDGTFKGGTQVAEDTYGMVVDFWVRTNAQGHYLILEGNVITVPTEEQVMGVDFEGNVVELYSLTRKVKNPQTGEVVKDANGDDIVDTYELYMHEGKWCNHDANECLEADFTLMTDGEDPIKATGHLYTTLKH